MPSNEICSDAGVGARDRFGEVGAAPDDREHAPAGGHELAVALRRAGVIDGDAGHRFGVVDAAESACPDSDDSG